MNGWDAFVFSFLNGRVAAQYAPKILEGLGLTILLAICIVGTGLVLGLVLAVIRALAESAFDPLAHLPDVGQRQADDGVQPVLGTSRADRLRACAESIDVKLSREEWYRLFETARGKPMP